MKKSNCQYTLSKGHGQKAMTLIDQLSSGVFFETTRPLRD